MPNRRVLDGLDQPLDGRVTLQNQAGIQSDLRAVGESGGSDSGIERAERVAIAPPVLVIALARRDKRQ